MTGSECDNLLSVSYLASAQHQPADSVWHRPSRWPQR